VVFQNITSNFKRLRDGAEEIWRVEKKAGVESACMVEES
jgi:hypothetical protein